MRGFFPFCLLAVAILMVNCEPAEERFTNSPNASLTFSTDTLLFDTVFTEVTSITRRFNVFNPNDNQVLISSLSLGGGNSSPYNLIVRGQQGRSFENLPLLGGDSLLVLVDVEIDPRDENLPFLEKDSVVFITNGNVQDVKLVAFGQDANFIVGDSILPCNTVWTADRPYVLFGSVLVDTLCQLTIEPGTQIFADVNSFLIVRGTLNALGTPENRILFRNVRLEDDFENSFGQWGGIAFAQGSNNNRIEYTDIRNGTVGLNLDTQDQDDLPELVVTNTRIENMSGAGIFGIGADLRAENVLVNNCFDFVLLAIGGGNYELDHCTFANFSFDFFRDNPVSAFSTALPQDDGSNLIFDVNLRIRNSIIWGSLPDDELIFDNSEGGSIFAEISNSLLRSTNDQLAINGNILNEDPLFIDEFNFDYNLDTLSPAQDTGIFIGINSDIEGNLRDSIPDIGAFERIELVEPD